jgi:predicted RNase H-like HicB family nuclease
VKLPTPENQRFASVWDALEDAPEQAASMKARSALRMALEAELVAYPVAIEPGNDTTASGVVVPDLPGCFSAGDTLEEAMIQAEEAMSALIEVALNDGQKQPDSRWPAGVSLFGDALGVLYMDFSPWDWATHFPLHEAACLIAGVMPVPVSKTIPKMGELPLQARPVLLALEAAYYEWHLQERNPERPKTIPLRGILNPDGTMPEFPVLSVVDGEIVRRAEIRDFIAKKGHRSAYDFGTTGALQPPAAKLSPEPEQDAPVVAVGASGGVSWTLIKPKRFQGYGKPLHDLLRAAQIDGKPCPTARDVLDTWQDKMPPEVMEVMTGGLKYYDAKGDAKHADLNAIRKAIGRMTR